MDGPPAMTLGLEPARQGIMDENPRASTQGILTGQRLIKLLFYGLTMAAGTLAAYAWGAQSVGPDYAMTMAFTTFVLFQFFNIFNARSEHTSTFNRQFFSNGKLWLSISAVVLLQIAVVHWAPAQAVFDTVDLSLSDWLVAAGVASSVLILDEARKLLQSLFRPRGSA
jgi:Ca2+-transporting ATPase